MTLSLLQLPLPAPHPIWVYRLDTGGGPKRVLMIEDDLSIATMYKLQLETDQYQVDLATDGASGLHLAQSHPPDIVLLDLRLPKLGGLEVLKALAGDPRLAALPVIVLSNYSEPAVVREGLQLGAREYLVKSQTTPVELSATVRKHLPND